MKLIAANGINWTRGPGGTSTGRQLVTALEGLRLHFDVTHIWDWKGGGAGTRMSTTRCGRF